MQVRELIITELPSLVAIDQAVNLSPWNLNHYQASFNNINHTIMGVFKGQELVGGLVYSRVLDEIEILQLCIKKNVQHQGYASFLLTQVFSSFQDYPYYSIFLEVRADNLSALNLYLKFSFNQINTRKNYYYINNKYYHAIIMAKELNRKQN